MRTLRLFSVWVTVASLTLLLGSLAACDDNTGVGSGEYICDDNMDNDGDGLSDCDDPDCVDDEACLITTEIDCEDATDNDGDGLTDCDDPDCVDDPACSANVERECDDDLDNDEDGAIDCLDTDCADDPACEGVETVCDDNQDNDGDTYTDCDDPDCRNAQNCIEARVTCSDVLECVYGCGAVSNYNCITACGADGCDTAKSLIQDVVGCAARSCYNQCQSDLNSTDCQACIGTSCTDELAACVADDCPIPTTETDCTDEVDNDMDGDTDCDDTDCASYPTCTTSELTCTEILTCAESCGTDYNCVQACQAAGCQVAQDIVDAILQNCGQTCGMTCIQGLGSTACQTCLASNCPTEWAACQADDCTGTVTFETNCNDQTDNDGDNLVDCDDPDCSNAQNCQVGTSTCSEILDCIDTCGSDWQCRQACPGEGCTTAQTAYDALRTSCFGTYGTPGPCPRTGGGACSDIGSQTCIDCMTDNCGTDYTACLDDSCQ